ncbi:DUF6338 family protein [Streptomyces sp. ADMS]|uniref:DUF6338 family protein n=1 Tax=Streptomyces sp. ADMS TaxID=3071415 RepID=UPI00296F33D5|nr:DUF6338 family protein [Streptomyces sp. ADMS]MDW4910774.1 DUF6338 family protein [Streptomyces sp. ADMS]
MPTNVVGFVMLVVLALPGYVYHQAFDRHVPKRVHTSFMELVSILFASVIVDAVALSLLKAGSSLGFWYTPAFRALYRSPRTYITDHFTAISLWSAAALALACVIGYGAGAGQWQSLLPALVQSRLHARTRRLEPQHSAWWLLFREHRDADVYVGCVLDDGSYLAGLLHSYSRVPSEHGDRELTLRGDISYRPPGDDVTVVLPEVNAAAVSARRLTFLTVSYVPRAADLSEPAAAGPPAASTPPPLPLPLSPHQARSSR